MWQQIINRLITGGMSEREIARRCSVSQPTINRLRTGAIKEPMWTLGKCLCDIDAEIPAAKDEQEAA